MTTTHGMINNPIPWPDGARCAVAITFDVDVDSFLHLQRPADSYKRVSTLSTLQYDPNIGVPRILQTYRELGLKQTFFIPAWCIERYPAMAEAIVREGHEIGHHGYIHEHVNELSEQEERFWLRKSIEIIERHTGKRPRGFRAPLYNFSPATTDLLIDEGFQYDASLMGDDVPYLLRGKKGHLVELPTHWAMDDWPPYVHMSDIDYVMPIRSPQEAIGVYKAEFDAMWEYGGLLVAVWHPFVTGRLARWHETVRFIEYMQSRGGVWFATLEEIAAHVNKVRADGRVHLHEEQMPPYPGPVTFDKF
ncbi:MULTISPECIES: polysaccharide deacetylase family protein [unclassified Brenneria]|uniref:polysaccharide deacetylase family protein n=1 Tax=unclassified Brenneria TaxID=2634434 RepID=UPI0018F06DF3|nr:polysaccharide deacetylase [Brenneria sp. L3-3C-1]MBJ7222164.1 polysaccharide deacetylase [Brenneria sp. L3-3C-1]MEE3643407.1 polysaccharide deacetylase [Brenneria sp. L3_3C_1]